MRRRQRSPRAFDASSWTCVRAAMIGTKRATPISVPFSSTKSKRLARISDW